MAVFRRADFEERMEQVRRKTLPQSLGVVLIWGFGFPLLLALHAYRVVPSSSLFALMMVLVAAFVAGIVVSAVRLPRLRRQLGLVCPSCNAVLSSGGRGRGTPNDIVMTGKCPKCGIQLLDPSEVGSRPGGPLTLRDHLEGLSMIAALLLAIAGLAFFGQKSLLRMRSETCARRYAAAHTAADSVRVDQSGFRKSKSSTCATVRAAVERAASQ